MIRLGIIGAGHFALAHLKALEGLGERVRVAAMSRRDLEKPLAEHWPSDVRRMPVADLLDAEGLDAVAICAPNHLHRRFAETALRAGKHVFCEKPLAMTVEDADAMIRTAKETGRVLVAGHITRHYPLYAAIAEIVSSGRIGVPRTINLSRMHAGEGRWWRMNPDIGGGVVFDLLVHDFDLVNWFMGKPSSVVARGHRHGQGAYDQVAAIFDYNQGDRTALVDGNLHLQPPCGVRSTLRLICTRGHLEVETGHLHAPIRLFERDAGEMVLRVPAQDGLTGALRGEYAEFLDAIEGAPPTHLKLEHARTAIAMAASVIESASTGQEVSIP